MTGTVINKFNEVAEIRIIPAAGDAYRGPFARIACGPDVELGDLVAFDTTQFDMVGDQEILLATSPVVVQKSDGTVPTF